MDLRASRPSMAPARAVVPSAKRRPAKLQRASTSSNSSVATNGSISSSGTHTSAGSYSTNASSVYANGSWNLAGLHLPLSESQRSSSTISQRYSRPPTGSKAIDRLPQEVMDNVVAQLRAIHHSPRMASCTTCYLRDLHAMCMTSKTWRRAARQNMYERDALFDVSDTKLTLAAAGTRSSG
jgi:hypothetical protein